MCFHQWMDRRGIGLSMKNHQVQLRSRARMLRNALRSAKREMFDRPLRLIEDDWVSLLKSICRQSVPGL